MKVSDYSVEEIHHGSRTLTKHAYVIFINGLLTTQQSFLAVLMHICYCYSLKWRYEFNNSKSGVVTFGETKSVGEVRIL